MQFKLASASPGIFGKKLPEWNKWTKVHNGSRIIITITIITLARISFCSINFDDACILTLKEKKKNSRVKKRGRKKCINELTRSLGELWASKSRNETDIDSHIDSGFENEDLTTLRALSVASSELVYTVKN